jgi:MFS transporter, DHA2 family, multidrug resistance protein
MTTSTHTGALAVASAAPRPTNKWLVTVSISFGTLMGAIDSSIVNVALPRIQGTVGATVQEITWVATGYAVALVLLMPLTAFLGRMFGQKRVYMVCLVLFLVGSALCGTATTLEQLVLYRVIQGLGAGALQPTEQAILRQTFPPREQGMAMALFAMVVMLGPAIGPTLGGYIVDHVHWSWIFFINLPIGTLGLFMVGSFVHEDEGIRAANRATAERERKNVDWFGIGLLSVGLSMLEYFLEEGQRNDWFDSKLITACFAVAVVSIALFVVRELTAPAPVVNLRLFKDSVFLSGTLIGALMFALLMANMFLLPIFMQELLGFTATQSGVALVPRILIMMVATPIVGRLYNYVPPRIFVAFGILAFALGSYQLAELTLESGQADVIYAILVQGIGFACLFVPLTTVALAKIPRHKMADATGLNSLLRQIGGAIGLAIFATMLDRYTDIARTAISTHVTPGDVETLSRLAAIQHGLERAGMPPPSAKSAAIVALNGTVARQALVVSFDRIFLLAGIVFLFVLPLLVFLKAPKQGEEKTEAAHVEL